MGWDKGGRYYTRSRRVDGRVVREYVGGGPAGVIVARMDAVERDRRLTDRECDRLERERIDALDAAVIELGESCDLLARAALLAAGYRQHHRGDWRRRRGRRDEAG
jgi:hypothetical protein